ncbi:putative methyltransferase-domain-containing protein [Crepidotus variabilis]|uniref:Protein N-terminal and lysine N-methyltransferase EFM7 n=1 Tax=Crepidotus variabilis TaxID=179855 RepID=A0A9P6E8D3_9AGAR|nr:putative methyltransferase-domain-containing protein [Crepidotus variabilis]
MLQDEEELGLDTVFVEPPRPPSPIPTSEIYHRDAVKIHSDEAWKAVEIRLVGSHPLWGHHLWNAAKALATYLDQNTGLYQGRNVLELGAGGALPSIVAVNNGASKVVITDYPDRALIENIDYNVVANVPSEKRDHTIVQGYIWGRSVENLLSALPDSTSQAFDLVILSDLIFNHSQHDALLNTCRMALSTSVPDQALGPCVLVFYTHHRPHLAHRDMDFFAKAENKGWKCEKILEKVFPPMFPNDPGEEIVRSTVHGWKLTLERVTF